MLHAAGDDPDRDYGLGESAIEATLPFVGEQPVTVHRARPCFWIGESALLACTSRLIGTTRSSLQRALAGLEEGGAIRRGYAGITILDRARLERPRDEA